VRTHPLLLDRKLISLSAVKLQDFPVPKILKYRVFYAVTTCSEIKFEYVFNMYALVPFVGGGFYGKNYVSRKLNFLGNREKSFNHLNQ
jgi:hypothetical protein